MQQNARKEQELLKREATREKILEASVALFAEKGFAATSARDIAKLANVSVGLMYHYFKSKEDVFEAIIEDAVKSIHWFKELHICHKCPRDTLEELIKEAVRDMHKDYEYSQWMVLLAHPLPPKLNPIWAEKFTNYQVEYISYITKLIDDGQKQNKIKKGNSAQMAQCLVSALHGACCLQIILKEAFIVPKVEMLMGGILL